jgi:hypothetical protein
MSLMVFTGPTIDAAQARDVLAAEYRPPARVGHVLAAALTGPEAIVIIDGLFDSVPAIWHKEILFALSCGIHVYGASSMGALRAAELHTFGMVGVGRIFEMYRDAQERSARPPGNLWRVWPRPSIIRIGRGPRSSARRGIAATCQARS